MTFENFKRILITGATGSFGKIFLERILNLEQSPERIVVFSRDELKQWDLQQKYPRDKYPQLRFFLGDIRDKDRLNFALNGIDTVVHAAALKQVPAAEYNPMEFIKTNVYGVDNLIKACLETDVERLVALSTDKAASPINLYGATKLCGEKLMISANNIKGNKKIKISVVRYGNVMGSRGSVIPYFLETAKKGFIPITHEEMTRFNISLDNAVDMVLWTLKESFGGEIVVPKIPSYKIVDLANAIGPNCEHKIMGIRSGEKLHEELITSSESLTTLDIGKYYLIFPSDRNILDRYKKTNNHYKEINKQFSYNSMENNEFLSIEKLRELIKENVDSNFKYI